MNLINGFGFLSYVIFFTSSLDIPKSSAISLTIWSFSSIFIWGMLFHKDNILLLGFYSFYVINGEASLFLLFIEYNVLLFSGLFKLCKSLNYGLYMLNSSFSFNSSSLSFTFSKVFLIVLIKFIFIICLC